MKICTSSKQLRQAVKHVQPSKIAVAFVGSGWNKYVSSDQLKEIVISPTIGSNPKAIEEIMDIIGAKNVYFLDNLHSKIFIGSESALLGSANLSDNGFADSGLLETGVTLTAPADLEKLSTVFDDYKAEAKRLYPTEKSKKKQLKKLMSQWQKSVWYKLNNTERDSNAPPSIANYRSELERIHIAWYQPGKIDYNEEAINGVVPDTIGTAPDNYFSDAMLFHEDDSLQPGDWILCWHCNNDGYPRQDGCVYWMHVHHVVPNGAHDETYTKLACEAKHLSCPMSPFNLDKPTKKLIRDALNSGKYPELLSLNDDAWKLAPADKIVPKFLDYLKKFS